jgi:hypothetical protein
MSVLIRLFVWERSNHMELKFLPSLPGAVAMSITEVVTALYAAYTMSRYTRLLSR